VATAMLKHTRANDQHDEVIRRVKRFFMCVIPPYLHRRGDQPPTSRSNGAKSQKTNNPTQNCWLCFRMGFRLYTFHDNYFLAQF